MGLRNDSNFSMLLKQAFLEVENFLGSWRRVDRSKRGDRHEYERDVGVDPGYGSGCLNEMSNIWRRSHNHFQVDPAVVFGDFQKTE